MSLDKAIEAILHFFLRIDMAVHGFFTRLQCDEAGHPITFTGTAGSSCACGRKRFLRESDR